MKAKTTALLSVTALLILLVTASAGSVQSQDTQRDAEITRFLEQRIREPGVFPQHPGTTPKVLATPQSHHIWQFEVVDEEAGGYTNRPSLKLDAADRPHISYYDADHYDVDLKYAYRDGGKWHVETVDSDGEVGGYNSLALDAKGLPHISYQDWENDSLNYAYHDGVQWQIETVDIVGQYTSLALSSSGQPHICYVDSNDNLKCARYDGTTWRIDILETDCGAYSISLVLDSSDAPHVSYYCGGIKYARRPGSTWLFETLEGGGETSLALDSGDLPHIAYSRIKYAWHDGVTWHIETLLDFSVWSISLALDLNNRPHIAYVVELDNHRVEHIWHDGTAWRTETAAREEDDTRFIDSLSLAIDSTGRPHIAYHTESGSGKGYITHGTYRSYWIPWSQLTFASYRDMNWEIYTAQGDGVSPVRLTYDPATDSAPDVSPDATQIVFHSTRDGNYEIYRMNADGSGQTRLTTTISDEYLPQWSPDGTRIAFYSYRDGNAEIYVMNADGSGQTRLTTDPAWDGHPAWSPDGSQLVFVSERSGLYELWTMNADGSNQQQLSSGLSYAAYPDWSPDGSRIAFNDDFNQDGFLGLAIINVDGTGLTHPRRDPLFRYDYLAPTWAPHGQNLAFAEVQWIEYQGKWYWVDAYLYDHELNSRINSLLTNTGYDWWPDWQSVETLPPTSQMAALPPLSPQTFEVQWSGSDNGPAGLCSYDVQFRRGASGQWTDWLQEVYEKAATFSGTPGYTYYFRCRARDCAGNLEPYPDGDGDAATHIYAHTLSGRVRGNHDQPVAMATVGTSPPALNTAVSGPDGTFALYFDGSMVCNLEASHDNFGSLPPMMGVSVDETSGVTLYLPPADDRITDGGFEVGDLAAWDAAGATTPTLTTTAHTGEFAVSFSGQDGVLAQKVSLASDPYTGTLSLLYRVEAADPVSDSLQVVLNGLTHSITYTLPLTPDGWIHWWRDVISWQGPTMTLQVQWAQGQGDLSAAMLLDEVSLGMPAQGAHLVYLPVIGR